MILHKIIDVRWHQSLHVAPPLQPALSVPFTWFYIIMHAYYRPVPNASDRRKTGTKRGFRPVLIPNSLAVLMDKRSGWWKTKKCRWNPMTFWTPPRPIAMHYIHAFLFLPILLVRELDQCTIIFWCVLPTAQECVLEHSQRTHDLEPNEIETGVGRRVYI